MSPSNMLPSKKTYHLPYKKLKGFARENGITYADMANLLGVTASTISMKINGYSDFYLSEVLALCEKYNATLKIFD